MNIFQAAFLGIVEGVTEYLPISSTFHLIWASRLLGISQTEFQKLFEVVIQSGAILAIVFLYFQYLLRQWNLIKKIAFSFLPTATVGLILYKVIKNFFFESFTLQIVVFIFVGVIFILFEMLRKKKVLTKNALDISYKEALVIGLAQALAVIPGVSRAGAVILPMMYLGVKREEAAKYSFLLAVPTMFAASALDLFQSRSVLVGQLNNMGLLVVGFLVSFVSAMLVVKWFVSYLQKNDLSVFGWYRLILVIIFLLLIRL